MDENVSALYALLLEKTRLGTLSWTLNDAGSTLIAEVGSQVVKITGFRARPQRGQSTLSLTALARNAERHPTIVVYDGKLNVVASGGVNGPPVLNAFMAGRPSDFEDISSPKLLELAELLDEMYSKRSGVKLLVEALKAS